MTYKLFTAGQGRQVLRVVAPDRTETVALIDNSPKGWIAHRAVRTDRVSSMGPIFEPTGAGVNVQHMINQPNGGDLVAEALGL